MNLLKNFIHKAFDNRDYIYIFKDCFYVHRKTQNVCIQPSKFREKFTVYLKELGIDIIPSFQNLRESLLLLGIGQRKMSFMTKSCSIYYVFNEKHILENL